jgi:hypothetical protein
MVQRPLQEGFHLLIEPLADAAHLRFRDAAGPAQRLHQRVDLAGGDPAGVGLHDDGVERLIDPAAGFEPVGKEAALPEFGDGQGEVTHLGGEHPLAVAVAVGGPIVRAALVELGTNGSGHSGFQEVLKTPAHDLWDQGASGGALHELGQLGGVAPLRVV